MPGGGIEFACEKPKERENPEHVLKTLQNVETSEEKLAALCKKYTELLEEHRTMQSTIKQNQRTITVLSREKDQLQSEHSKAVLAKSRLEGLCRELQKHNKMVKDESTARAKEDEERRKEVSTKFQTTINEIQQQMNDHYQKNTSLREENLELANKLKGLIEQYELREEHIEKILKTKEIEGQLYEAKLQQAALQLAEDKERSLQEKQKLLQETMEAQKRIALLEQQEEILKTQLTVYSEKYEDFQSTLSKSSSVFENFKTEMEKMTKKIKKLEKETTTWRQKWESSNKALLTLAEEKALSQKESALLQNKIGKLESLCRALQEERRKYGNAKDVVSLKTQVETATKTPSESSPSESTLGPDGSVDHVSSPQDTNTEPVHGAEVLSDETTNSQQTKIPREEVEETAPEKVSDSLNEATPEEMVSESSSKDESSVLAKEAVADESMKHIGNCELPQPNGEQNPTVNCDATKVANLDASSEAI